MIAAGRRRRAEPATGILVAVGVALLAAVPVSHADDGDVEQAKVAADAPGPEIHWYRLALDGRPCGQLRRESVVADGRRRVVEETTMAVARDGTEVRIEIRLETLETAGGRLLEVSRRFDAGGVPSETRWSFGAGAVEEVRIEGTRRSRREIALPAEGEFLSPEAARAFFAARRDAGAATVNWTTVSFEQGFEIVEVVATRVGEATFAWADRTLPVARWRLESTGTPFPVEERWSRDGRLVESRVATGLGELVAQRATADAAAGWRRGDLPDLVAATVVPLEGRLPAQAKEIRLRVGIRPGAEVPTFPTTDRQRFERAPEGAGDSAGAGWLSIRRRAAAFSPDRDPDRASEESSEHDADGDAPRGSTPGPDMLEAGPLLEIDDPRVRQLALEEAGVDPEASAAVKAERLRRFVRSWIRRKDLATALAGAAEVARSRSGDCTEHATLLAALLRIHGIPSRIAVGLVHAERFAGRRNVFAWHAWTQGWIDGRWVDLDATAARPEDGVRIAVAFGDLAGGAFDPLWSAALPVMGAIELAVVPASSVPDGDGAP